MFKFGAFLLSSIVISSIHCGVVKREDSPLASDNIVYKSSSVAEAGQPGQLLASIELASEDGTSFSVNVNEDTRVERQLASYAPSNNVFLTPTSAGTSYGSSSIAQTAYTVSPSVATASPSVATATTSTTGNPIGALTAIFAPSNSKGSGSSAGGSNGVQDFIGGAVGAATNGVRTVLEVKRDLILPLILGILNLGQNVANSEVLRTIVDVKVTAAKTVLSIGPVIVEILGGIASTAGDVTSGIFKTIICNIICPIHKEPNTCRAQSSCSSGSSSPGAKTSLPSSSSSKAAQDYVVT